MTNEETVGQKGEGVGAITPLGRLQPKQKLGFRFPGVRVGCPSQGFPRRHRAVLGHALLPQAGVPSGCLGRRVELNSRQAC